MSDTALTASRTIFSLGRGSILVLRGGSYKETQAGHRVLGKRESARTRFGVRPAQKMVEFSEDSSFGKVKTEAPDGERQIPRQKKIGATVCGRDRPAKGLAAWSGRSLAGSGLINEVGGDGVGFQVSDGKKQLATRRSLDGMPVRRVGISS